MKKTFLIGGLALLSLASCKKDYSCSCTETDTYDGETDVYVSTYTVSEATKKQAQVACNEATIKQVDGADSYTVKCELSK